MLLLPSKGFNSSVRTHNVRKDIFADWLEGSVVFTDEEISQSDVVDVLCENNVYQEQDFAAQCVTDVWTELRRRQRTMKSRCLWQLRGRTLIRSSPWDTVPTYSFCLFLSLLPGYRRWWSQFAKSYNEQGALFERVTAESLESTGWTVHLTGWQREKAKKIHAVIGELCDLIGESPRMNELEKWVSEHANDEGLDLVCWDPYADGWGGRPLYFLQCASGENWPDKTHTPNPDTWARIVSFTNKPVRAFAIPFALLEREFTRTAGLVDGLLLDRCRLHAMNETDSKEWASKNLTAELVKWLSPQVNCLPTAS